MEPLKFGNIYVFAARTTLLGVWLLVHAGIKVNKMGRSCGLCRHGAVYPIAIHTVQLYFVPIIFSVLGWFMWTFAHILSGCFSENGVTIWLGCWDSPMLVQLPVNYPEVYVYNRTVTDHNKHDLTKCCCVIYSFVKLKFGISSDNINTVLFAHFALLSVSEQNVSQRGGRFLSLVDAYSTIDINGPLFSGLM